MAKLFTYQQAQASLVFVRPILEDIRSLSEELWLLRQKERVSEEKIRSYLEKIEYFLQELKQVGCICKDIEQGLIDFPSIYQNEAIFLCWKLGENGVKHWHFAKDGYHGRQKIDKEFLSQDQTHVNSLASS